MGKTLLIPEPTTRLLLACSPRAALERRGEGTGRQGKRGGNGRERGRGGEVWPLEEHKAGGS